MEWQYRFIIWISIFHISIQNKMTKSDNLSKRNDIVNRDRSILYGQSGSTVSFTPQVTEKCEKLGICEDIPNYPEQYVNRMIKQKGWLNKATFNVDVLEPQLRQRIGPSEEYLELCESIQKLITPRAARDINNNWHFILNSVKEPQQKYLVEVCVKQDVPCAPVASFALGYRGRCFQKYVLRKMTALDKYGNIIENPFYIPSCCSCVYKLNTK